MLEQQRAALLMLISALTLVPEQQLLMPRASRLSFGAESPDLDSVQQWFQERFRVQRKSKVYVNLCLKWRFGGVSDLH